MRIQEFLLHYNRPVRITGALVLECTHGCVWLTRTGGAGDIFLRPGDRYRLDWPDMVLVEALHEAGNGARLLLHETEPLWRRAIGSLGPVLSSLHERMRALRRVGRRGPLAG